MRGKNEQNNLIIRLRTDCYHAILNVAKQVSKQTSLFTIVLGFDGRRQSLETGHRNLWFFSTSQGASKHKKIVLKLLISVVSQLRYSLKLSHNIVYQHTIFNQADVWALSRAVNYISTVRKPQEIQNYTYRMSLQVRRDKRRGFPRLINEGNEAGWMLSSWLDVYYSL